MRIVHAAVRGVGPGTRAGRHLLRCLALLAVASTATVAACSREASAPQLAPETFIGVMVALRQAHEVTTSPEAFAARREEILREAGVTDSLLVRWIRSQGNDVARLSALWDSVNSRLMAVEEADTLR